MKTWGRSRSIKHRMTFQMEDVPSMKEGEPVLRFDVKISAPLDEEQQLVMADLVGQRVRLTLIVEEL